MNWVESVERLGGWAVVVWIVWWLTSRLEKKMERVCDAITDMTKAITKLANATGITPKEKR